MFSWYLGIVGGSGQGLEIKRSPAPSNLFTLVLGFGKVPNRIVYLHRASTPYIRGREQKFSPGSGDLFISFSFFQGGYCSGRPQSRVPSTRGRRGPARVLESLEEVLLASFLL